MYLKVTFRYTLVLVETYISLGVETADHSQRIARVALNTALIESHHKWVRIGPQDEIIYSSCLGAS